MNKPVLAFLAVVTSLSTLPPGLALANSANAEGFPYAETGWTTTHANRKNDDYVDVQPAQKYQKRWSAKGLGHASVLAAAIPGTNGMVYFTTGLAQGHSNLHAYDENGNQVAASAPWVDQSGLDSAASVSSPIVDTNGDIYVGDSNQFWAFKPDLSVKWVIDLPAAPTGAAWNNSGNWGTFNPFITAIFTKDGHVGGVTAFGQVVIVDRETGELQAPVFNVPATFAPKADDLPLDGLLWENGEFDPNMQEAMWHIIFGSQVISANTPAMDKDGYLWLIATDSDPEYGALFKIKINPKTAERPGSISVACKVNVGLGSGTSPALNMDESIIIVSDNDGFTHGVRSENCTIAWSTQTGSQVASASVGPYGLAYVPTSQKLAAVDYTTGELKWETDFSDLANELLPQTTGLLAGLLFEAPRGDVTGLTTVTSGGLVVPVTFGYPFSIERYGRSMLMPVKAGLVLVNKETGKTERLLVEMPASGEAFTTLNKSNPTIFQTYGCAVTAAMDPLRGFVNWVLENDDVSMMPHYCGVDAFEPIDK